MCRWLLAAACVLSGCASVGSAPIDPLHDQSSNVPLVDLAEGIISNDDMATAPARDDAGHPIPVVDMAQPITPGADMATVPCSAAQHLVINEVQAGGSSSASDEFVEIYNPCTTDSAPIGNWTLLHRSASGTSDTPTIKIPSGKSVPKNGYFLIAGPAYSGAKPYDIQYSSAMLSATGGGLGLKDSGGKLVDSMGYGSTATNTYVVGSPATAPPDGKSMARTPNGSTAHMNDAQDFAVATPSPGSKN
jgi:hypothetical protein